MEEDTVLEGGMMNSPVKKGNVVIRPCTASSATIHRLLRHARSRGLTWVPEPIALDDTSETLSFIEGEVPHSMPSWIWNDATLINIARRMRQWHDATEDFSDPEAVWSFDTGEKQEVICHNDFAPYNCVYKNQTFEGLIDFDLCAPGTRLWDIAYTTYRFIPIMPVQSTITDGSTPEGEYSPYPLDDMFRRTDRFLAEYAQGNHLLLYTRDELLEKTARRITAVAEWTKRFAEETHNDVLRKNAIMYREHSTYIENLRTITSNPA